MKKVLLLSAGALALVACTETKWNAAPSIFPPVNGAATLPSQAQGFYQGRDSEFLRQLTDLEQEVFDKLTPAQQARALQYIRAGGTLYSSFGSDT